MSRLTSIQATTLLFAWTFYSCAQPNPETALPLITAAQTVLALSPALADSKIPCALKGVVTCSAPAGSLLFVQDNTAGVYVYWEGKSPEQGSLVEIKGHSGKGLFAPIVMADSLQVLGVGPLPKALPVAVEQLASGRYDAQWVEVEGVVMRQTKHWGHVVLVLGSGSARLEVRILNFDPADLPSWVDARIRIKGVPGTTYNDRRQLTGFHLLTQSTPFITVLEAPVADLFDRPLRSSGSLLSYSPGGASEHSSRLHGVVTWSWPGQGFYLRDREGEVKVLSRQEGSLEPGDIVDVAGFAMPTLNRPVLQEAVYRKAGRTNAPFARETTVLEAASGAHDGELISIEGVILQTGEKHLDHSAFVVAGDKKVFRARFQDTWELEKSALLAGSRVRLVGVCAQDSDSPSEAQVFSVWLRNAGDMEILHRSPAWRQRLAIWGVGGLGGGVLVAGAWIGLMRQRVRQQTEVIRKREAALEERYLDLFENANDIIFTQDLLGNFTSLNTSGESILGFKAQELVGRNFESLIEPDDLEISRTHLQTLFAGSARTNYEVRIRARNSQLLILEVSCRLAYQEGVPTGVQGIARDITARKEAESVLRASERQLRASLKERERLGRDLHDDIIQSIYAAGLNLDDCARAIGPNQCAVEQRLRTVTGDLNRIIREVRNFIVGLEHSRISGDEFTTVLKSLALTVGEKNSAHIVVDVDDRAATRLDSHQASQLLVIAREALSNSIRHACATKLAFQLQLSAPGIRFEIEDNGVGFNTSFPGRPRRGLRNMARRAQEIGATFQIDSRIGEGTRIVLDLSDEKPNIAPGENPSSDS